MTSKLCISVTFLHPLFHGKSDGDRPEWPPSPLRLFQALLAGDRSGSRNHAWSDEKAEAFRWLERQDMPQIIAPLVHATVAHIYYVPNNDADKEFERQERLAEKVFQPHRMLKEDSPTLHYLWSLPNPLSSEVRTHIKVLSNVARSIVALGWGIDMAIGHAALLSDEQVKALSGERWIRGIEGVEDGLRVPTSGTLNALIERHERFLMRVRPDGTFDPTPPLPESAYRKIEYRRATDPPRRLVAAFSLLKSDASGFRPFDTVRSNLTLAGMMRHAVTCAARRAGWPESKIAALVLGHGEPKNENHVPVGSRRFAYLPLPSIEGRGEGKARVDGSVRRLMLTALFDDCENEIAWARRALSGRDLIDENSGQSAALLSLLPGNEKMVRCYGEPADTWATVTPVVLPGYDDPSHYRRRLKKGVAAEEQKRLLERLNDRVDGLLRNAIVQAGFSKELADHAELEWRKVGFWAGTDLADRYGVPDHLKRFPRIHVRLRWRDAQNRPVAVPGPICLGGGRFYGLGLFAAE